MGDWDVVGQSPAPAPGAWDVVSEAPHSGTAYDVGASTLAGAGKGMSDFLGAVGDARNMAGRATDAVFSPETAQSIKNVASHYAPMGMPIGDLISHAPTSADVQHGIEKVTGEFHKPETAAGRYAETGAEFLGNPGSYLGPGSMTSKAVMAGASALGAQTADELGLGEGGRFAGAMLAGPLAGRALRPKLTPTAEAADLQSRGMTAMTPGQLKGGLLKEAEDKLMSWPVAGQFVKEARLRSIEDFNRAAGDKALASIGEKIDKTTPAGHDTVAEVERKLGDAYDKVLPRLLLSPDNKFTQDMTRIQRNVATLPKSNIEQFDAIIDNHLYNPERWTQQTALPPAMRNAQNLPSTAQAKTSLHMQGEQFKTVESELTAKIAQYRGSPNPGDREMASRLNDVLTAMRSNLERNNPKDRQWLQRVNAGWAMYSRIRGAAANRTSSQGVFTPNDLNAAVKRGDKSVGKGAFAKGDALMQDIAGTAQEVLPSTVPNSGTFDRLAYAHLLKPHILAGAALGAGMYSPLGIKAANALARPPTGPVGRALQDYAETGRGVGALRPLLQANPFASGDNPYSPNKADGGSVNDADEAAMSPETYVNPFVKNALGNLAALPKRAIEASAEDVGHLGEEGYEPQSIAPAANTALLMAGAGSPFAVENAVGATGGRLAQYGRIESRVGNPANSNAKFELPAPLTREERDWQNYGKRMSPDDVLNSDIVWASANRAREAGGDRAAAFAQTANDLWRRMGANKYITPELAARHIRRQEGLLNGVGVANPYATP